MVWLPVFGISNVHTDADAWDCTQGCMDAVRMSALEAALRRKFPCCTGDLNPCLFSQLLSQLSCPHPFWILTSCQLHRVTSAQITPPQFFYSSSKHKIITKPHRKSWSILTQLTANTTQSPAKNSQQQTKHSHQQRTVNSKHNTVTRKHSQQQTKHSHQKTQSTANTTQSPENTVNSKHNTVTRKHSQQQTQHSHQQTQSKANTTQSPANTVNSKHNTVTYSQGFTKNERIRMCHETSFITGSLWAEKKMLQDSK